MRRQSKPKAPESHERWLITYADLITLLMIFFVIMYAMSQVNQIKFTALQKSLAAALHQSDQIPLNNMGTTALVSSGGTNTGDQTYSSTMQSSSGKSDKTLENLYQQVKAYIVSHHLENKISIENVSRGVQITLRDIVLFDTGKADLRPGASDILDGLIPFFKSLSNAIAVEGYTDDQPINTAEFPSNWELSGARAIGVVRFLVSQGIQPARLSGVGYGEYHNIVPNDSTAHRQMNRRVNIVVLRNESQQPAPGPSSQ